MDQKASAAESNANQYTDNKFAAIPTPDVSGQIETHNTNESAHADIRNAVQTAQTEISNIKKDIVTESEMNVAITNATKDHVSESTMNAAITNATKDHVTESEMNAAIEELESSLSETKPHASQHKTNGTDPLTPSDIGAVSLAGGTLNAGAGLNLSASGGSVIRLTGSSVSLDMRQVAGGWTHGLFFVTDATSKNTMVLGVKGNASGLSQVFFGGSASDPLVKLATDGQMTLKMKPLVGTESLVTSADVSTAISNATSGLVPTSRTVNGKPLSADVTLSASDVSAAAEKIGVVTVTASTTLALSHAEKTIRVNSSGAVTLTIPTNASVAFPVGTCIVVTGVGAGTVSFTPASGVTLNSKESKRTIDGQYAAVTLYKSDTNVWELWGALA